MLINTQISHLTHVESRVNEPILSEHASWISELVSQSKFYLILINKNLVFVSVFTSYFLGSSESVSKTLGKLFEETSDPSRLTLIFGRKERNYREKV